MRLSIPVVILPLRRDIVCSSSFTTGLLVLPSCAIWSRRILSSLYCAICLPIVGSTISSPGRRLRTLSGLLMALRTERRSDSSRSVWLISTALTLPTSSGVTSIASLCALASFCSTLPSSSLIATIRSSIKRAVRRALSFLSSIASSLYTSTSALST
ncbi:Uncharacterised protein [Chlamydia trachomatis]|nr:Uncharacterised protein [Chlamydia trachomatis]